MATQTWVSEQGSLTEVTSHNQASKTINLMTGYFKPASIITISTDDMLNTPIGKLETGIENKEVVIIRAWG